MSIVHWYWLVSMEWGVGVNTESTSQLSLPVLPKKKMDLWSLMGGWICWPLSLYETSLTLKKILTAQEQKRMSVGRTKRGGDNNCGWRKKCGSDLGLITLIPSFYGNTSSTPSPHDLTSSCLKQKQATKADSRAGDTDGERLMLEEKK